MSFLESDIFTDRCNHCQRLDLLDMINDALVLIKNQTGAILFMNEKALKMYQYTSEESLKLSIADIRYDSIALIDSKIKLSENISSKYKLVFRENNSSC